MSMVILIIPPEVDFDLQPLTRVAVHVLPILHRNHLPLTNRKHHFYDTPRTSPLELVTKPGRVNACKSRPSRDEVAPEEFRSPQTVVNGLTNLPFRQSLLKQQVRLSTCVKCGPTILDPSRRTLSPFLDNKLPPINMGHGGLTGVGQLRRKILATHQGSAYISIQLPCRQGRGAGRNVLGG